jgi:hypothetical protein
VTGPLYSRKVEPKLVRDLMIRPEGTADGHQDRPPIVVLEGGAATGKTAVLSEMAKRLGRQGALFLPGRRGDRG